MRRLTTWWDRLTDAERVQWTAVAGAIALFCFHYILWSPWLIEDAAISYSYALHAVQGDGWVAYPGGEPVEGFSNPTWTALLATTRLVGISPWLSAKLYGLLFGVLTLPMAFLWAKEVTRDDGLLPCIAPLWLAVSPQFTTWVACGLENPLWIWLLTLGSLHFLRELRGDGPSWSAVPMALLAITRPEGPLYVAAMAFTGAGLRWNKPRILVRIAVWSLACATVWGGYEAYRLFVFGWPFPNTYYAKVEVGVDKFQPFHWGFPGDAMMGWTQLRGWAAWSAFGFLLPVLPITLTGLKGWRGQLGLGLGAVLALVLLPGAHWLTAQPWWPLAQEPHVLVQIRVGLLVFVGVVLPWLSTREGREGRILAWMLTATLFAFAVYVGADWMQGHRWISLVVVPLSVILADLLVTVARSRDWAEPVRARRWVFAVFGGLPLAAGAAQAVDILSPTETSPFDVGRRVAYMNTVQERLHLDHAVNYDIDMGANMWWNGDEIIDIAGLVDIPVARHHWQQPFIREYVLRERRPHFMHAHDHWLSVAGLGAQPVFNRDWIRISDFVAGTKNMHKGNHVRKDTFIRPRWKGAPNPVVFDDKIRLEGLEIPSATVPIGGTVYVELGWRPVRDRTPAFRPVIVLSRGDRILTWDLPPAYDWVPVPRWRRSEVVHGFHSLQLPDDVEPGEWRVRVVVMDAHRGVWPADRTEPEPLYAAGEYLWAGKLTVASTEEVLTRVETRLQEMTEHATHDRCNRAEEALELARRHLPKDHRQQPWLDDAVHATIARCWAERAQETPVGTAEAAIARARMWDHRDPTVVAIARTLADEWEAKGDAAWEEGRTGEAYGFWRRTLLADPRRVRVRIRAEEARDVRLGLKEAPPG